MPFCWCGWIKFNSSIYPLLKQPRVQKGLKYLRNKQVNCISLGNLKRHLINSKKEIIHSFRKYILQRNGGINWYLGQGMGQRNEWKSYNLSKTRGFLQCLMAEGMVKDVKLIHTLWRLQSLQRKENNILYIF